MAEAQTLPIGAQFASLPIRKLVGEVQDGIHALPTADQDHIIPPPDTLYDGVDKKETFKVCIIGAGAAGLFTAMMFEHLMQQVPGLKIEYEILEANNDKRLGGRLFSYHFPQKDNQPPIGPHDYYDVGAMRFPQIKIMDRTFALFHELRMEYNKDVLAAQPGELVDYYLRGNNTPQIFNSRRVVPPEGVAATANDFKIKDIPEKYRTVDPGTLLVDATSPFAEAYKKGNQQTFWEKLMTEGDPYSVRQYLTTQLKDKDGNKVSYDYNTIEFLETMEFGNRWYDQAFSEMVIDDMEFDGSAPWRCVMGGAQEIAKRMRNAIEAKGKKISYQTKVTEIAIDNADPLKPTNERPINVTSKDLSGNATIKQYHAVFNSAPLGAQQHMKLEGMNLNYGTKQAIRSLGYAASCKVGIRFSSLWWIDKLEIDQGGLAKSDLPIKFCVYPSYNIKDPPKRPGVLLASYSWSQEAERIGALIKPDSPNGEDELKELLFHNLALIHSETDNKKDYDEKYALISGSYLDHYAYSWYSDPTTVGAFAFFGPGQFANMYPWITRSDGKYVVIGEASSSHHAWVVGALESASRGVYQFLYRHSIDSKACSDAALAFSSSTTSEISRAPYGPLPAEFNRSSDVKDPLNIGGTSPIGEMLRQWVIIEMLRQEQGGDQLEMEHVTKDQLSPLMPPGLFQALV